MSQPARALAPLETELVRHFGHDRFREGQREAIEAVLAGRDTVAVMPTGRGKSLCYQLPAVMLPGPTVVVSPLIALMKDQTDALAARGIPATFINGSLDPAEQAERIRALAEGAYRLVYVAPERFRHRAFVEAVAGAGVSLFAVDEAHCISEWGHQIRPDYLRLPEAIAACGRPPVLATTATATPEVRADIAAQLGLGSPLEVVSGFDRPNLRYVVRFASGREDKRAWLLRILGRVPGSAIVYAATRRSVDLVASMLAQAGHAAVAYHAGMADDARAVSQDRWMAGRARIVVATNAFGMGIDKPDVRSVVHYELPASLEAYYQEAGRAGRDGATAYCTLLYSAADRRVREFLIDRQELEGEVPEGLDPAALARRRDLDRAKLAKMVSYAYAERCRRNLILRYFGERTSGTCGRCDACQGQVHSQPAPASPGQPRAGAPPRVAAGAAPVEPELAPDPVLVAVLKEKRLELARAQQVPAFVVLHDHALQELAARRPGSVPELLAIRGIGPRKAALYGEALLSVIRTHR